MTNVGNCLLWNMIMKASNFELPCPCFQCWMGLEAEILGLPWSCPRFKRRHVRNAMSGIPIPPSISLISPLRINYDQIDGWLEMFKPPILETTKQFLLGHQPWNQTQGRTRVHLTWKSIRFSWPFGNLLRLQQSKVHHLRSLPQVGTRLSKPGVGSIGWLVSKGGCSSSDTKIFWC